MEGDQGLAHGIPARLTAAEGRKFAFPVGAAFLVLGAIVWWRGHLTLATVFGALAGTLVVLGAAIPSRLGPLFRAWMGLSHLISRITTPIFMGVVFFGVITPMSLLMRLLGKVPMRTPVDATTLWHTREPGSRRSDLTRQF